MIPSIQQKIYFESYCTLSDLKGFQKKHLRGLAHSLKPVVFIGKNGINDQVLKSMNDALNAHELIKVKFIDFKEKDQKKTLSDTLEKKTGSHHVGLMGHISIFYRMHSNPEKRKITLPS